MNLDAPALSSRKSRRRFDWPRRQYRFDPELDALFGLYAETVGLTRGAILRAILLRHLRLAYGHGRKVAEIKEAVNSLTPEDRMRYVLSVRSDFERFLDTPIGGGR